MQVLLNRVAQDCSASAVICKLPGPTSELRKEHRGLTWCEGDGERAEGEVVSVDRKNCVAASKRR